MKRRALLLGLVSALPLAATPQMRDAAQRTIPRRPVVPMEVIRRYELQPSEGLGLWVYGEDGKPYDLDTVLAAMFRMLQGR